MIRLNCPWLQWTQLSINLILGSCRTLSNSFHCAICKGFSHVKPYKLYKLTLCHNWYHPVLQRAIFWRSIKLSLGVKTRSNQQYFCIVLNVTASFVSFSSPGGIVLPSVNTHTSLLCCAIHRAKQIKWTDMHNREQETKVVTLQNWNITIAEEKYNQLHHCKFMVFLEYVLQCFMQEHFFSGTWQITNACGRDMEPSFHGKTA